MDSRGLAMSARRFCALTALFAFFATCFFATGAQADVFTGELSPAGTAQTLSPSIVSDKGDYSPGETVRLSGSNWQPGESVHIVVNDSAGATWSHSSDVTANDSGSISDSFNLPDWFVANYDVTASGSSGTATFTFTDSAVTFNFPVAATPANTYSGAQWNNGCVAAGRTGTGICGSTNGNNVNNVKLSIKRNSDNTFWNGSAYSGTAETF